MCNLNNITENYIQSNIYYIYICQPHIRQRKYPGFSGGPAVKSLPANARDMGLIHLLLDS